jgi:HPt (histidine-containing phosphotransfer) domain-containing protein
MTFEPAFLHQHVLNFYRTIGTVGSSPNRVSLSAHGPRRVPGSGQFFEQSLYFLLGHLLPDCDPLCGELFISSSHVRLRYRLPVDVSKADLLEQHLAEDHRLQHLLGKVSASCLMLGPDGRSPCYRIGLDFPIDSPSTESTLAIIDFKELLDRFDSPEIATQMMEWFVHDAAKKVSSIRTSIRAMEWQEAHRLSHSLKGSSLNLGAGSFALSAKEMELAIKEHRYQNVPEILKQLETACRELEAFWKNHHGELYG